MTITPQLAATMEKKRAYLELVFVCSHDDRNISVVNSLGQCLQFVRS